MDDCCAVCAEPLEWVAYGQCGHKDVCSTCVARLRFICEDRRCCICKTESDVVFITKALGDYTRNISDFTVFPSDSTEGKVGSFWFHEDMRAYFDDSDHYKMIKAMCRLTCSECDKMEEQGGNEGPKRKGKFRNIEQLKGHLYHLHKLFMCSLCLEGRKIFICEQKLYSRSQLNQHINTGDSEVDGSESERGGFMGHPMCDFCRKPFYGDNELYTHMSTEHFTCHICKRQNPGQFDYFKNYDDLEVHFRQQHFLCEDESCLAKKFIVFPSESEMKRHNAIEHGGNMSRAKRNAVLQIPTSFQYRRNNEQDSRRGRGRGGGGRGSYPDSSDNQLSQAIQASFETANSDSTIHDPSANAQVAPSYRETSGIDDIVGPMESLATTDAELSARYLQAVSHGPRNGRLEESSFPPLLMGSGNGQQNSQNDSIGLGKNTMAARLRRRNKGTVSVLNSAQPWGKTSRGPTSSSSSSAQSRLPANFGPALSSSSASSSQTKPAVATTNGPVPSSYASTAQASAFPSGSTWNSSSSASRVSHSVSAPNLVERGSLDSSSFPPVLATRKDKLSTSNKPVERGPLDSSNFPPVLATRKDKLSTSNKPVERGPLDSSNFPPVLATRKENVSSSNGHVVKVEDVQTANKSLVERMRSALDFDENKFTAFKEISGEFRQGVIETSEYLSYVQQFGLSHLVLELARLCPDTQKQRELIETYNASVRHDNARAKTIGGSSSTPSSVSNGSNKGKGKRKEEADNSLTDSILSTVRKLQANYKPSEDEVEVLSKDGYRKGKTISEVPMGVGASSVNQKQSDSNVYNDSSGVASNKNASGGSKQKKKISKFHRVRLGDGSAAAYLDSRNSDNEEDATDVKQSPSEGLPVRGAWRNGGGQKLVAMTQRGSPK